LNGEDDGWVLNGVVEDEKASGWADRMDGFGKFGRVYFEAGEEGVWVRTRERQ
jgi:hypothetical protein